MPKVCRTLLCLSGLMAVLFVAGCGNIQGSWMLCEFQPYLEKKDYRISKATFYPNNSFEAIAYQGKKMIKAKGMYDYNSCSQDLVLMTGDKCVCYKASLEGDKRLRITTCGPDCITTTAVMVKYNRCPPCLPCSPCMPVKPCSRCPQ